MQVGNLTLWPFYAEEGDNGINFTGGWLDLRIGLLDTSPQSRHYNLKAIVYKFTSCFLKLQELSSVASRFFSCIEIRSLTAEEPKGA
jgi:hypothetical protein